MSVMPARARLLLVAFAIAACISAAIAQDTCAKYSPYSHASLKVKPNGTFRILQVADVHYRNNNTLPCKDVTPEQAPYCRDTNSTAWLTALLALEKPDLVVFTGDNILYNSDAKIQAAVQDALVKPCNDAKIPYMLTFGNHDCESNPCQAMLIKADQKNKYSLTKQAPTDLHGDATYAYTVKDTKGKDAFALYIFDGGAYINLNNVTGNYDFIWPSQVNWYNQTSQCIEKRNGKKVPGIAFFHMPLPEYDNAWACTRSDLLTNPSFADFGNLTTEAGTGLKTNKGCSASLGKFKGVRQEGVYSSAFNGGLFSVFVQRGDVRMTNCGHDHVNDDCSDYMNIRLCYGGGFGYHAYGKAGWSRRARMIELNSNSQIVTTYKRLDKFGNYLRDSQEAFSVKPF